jgi:7-carboxy-7-deazaguanine synthase
MHKYAVNELFYSLQGEGARAGSVNVFVRFSGCNLQCSRDGEAGFDCDTEFTSGLRYDLDELVDSILETDEANCGSVIFTGGEPLLQLDAELVDRLRALNYYVAVETNGTVELKKGVAVDWISCSPKTAEHTMRLAHANELRYVRNHTQGVPKPSISAANYFLSPMARPDGSIDRRALEHCIQLCRLEPVWRLSVQQHKLWGVQ